MKKLLLLVFVCAFVLSLSGCGGGASQGENQMSFEYTLKPDSTSVSAGEEAESVSVESAEASSETEASSTSEATTEPTSAPSSTEPPTETASETTTQQTTVQSTEPPASAPSTEPYVGKVRNGSVSLRNGVYYINDESTGESFIIVNKTYPVPESYGPGGLTGECSAAFKKLSAAAAEENLSIWNLSGYRSFSTQKRLYNNYVSRDGRAAADKYSARPGHSEHQTGLAIDCNSLSTSWAQTAEGKWLSAHCAEFGFIIRYGADKISSTGYQYEPWHIRYIGSPALAQKITESGLSVEEYYGITSEYN